MKHRHRTLLEGLGRYVHGAKDLPVVSVGDYTVDFRDYGCLTGRRAFQSFPRGWPGGQLTSCGLAAGSPRDMPGERRPGRAFASRAFALGTLEAADPPGVVEELARELAAVARRLLATPSWSGLEHIAVGGELRTSRTGERAIKRASVLLRAEGHSVTMRPIRHQPDQAGLIGSAHLVPTACLVGHDAMLAIDVGGSDVRAGLIEFNLDDEPNLRAARTEGLCVCRAADKEPGRDEVLKRLAAMLADLVRHARKERYRLAPVVGLACPGVIGPDGRIKPTGQNLPGEGETADVSLPARLAGLLPGLDGQPVAVVMHNNVVIQGLSELPWLGHAARWGLLAVGPGLGSASFSNRAHQ